MYSKTENTVTKDEYGNPITIPAGFKVVIDSTTNNASHVTEGIVIQDEEGNQFVWVPVGKIYTTADEATKESTAETINLSRYEFADGTDKYQNEQGENLALGTPIDRGSSAIEDEYGMGFNFTEETANIGDFINNTNAAGGYYIARYEASYGTDKKPNSKVSTGTPEETFDPPTVEGELWNNIIQQDAATVSRDMYTSTEFTSDLVNSYAWDTAIVFIQTFGGVDYQEYSRQDGESINNQLTNTGVNGDNPLNINDMASNTAEWTTETYSFPSNPWTLRGGSYNFSHFYTTVRYNNSLSGSVYGISFRPLLYVQN